MKSPFLAVIIAALFILVVVPLTAEDADSKASSPDGGGYIYTDAMDPLPKIEVSYLMVDGDPNAVGMDTSNYNALLHVDIGFNFEYYGVTYSKIYISTYGAMSFVEDSSDYFNDYYNYILPSTSRPKGLMAVYWTWDHCQSNTKDRLYTLKTQIDGENVFAVEWKTQRGGQYQALLYESGLIQFNYRSVQSSYVTGSYCIIGIENPDSTTGTPYINQFNYQQNEVFPLPFSIAFTNEEISVDRVELINGDGSGQNKIYAGSKSYIFRTDVTHSNSNNDIISAILTLGSKWGQEMIRLVYWHQNNTFQKLSKTDFADLDLENCNAQKGGSYGLTIYFHVDFKIPYPSEERRNVSVRATGKSAIPGMKEEKDLYYVEDDLEWDPDTLLARRTSGDESYVANGDYVAGGEKVHFSRFRIFYERSTVQPPPDIIQVNISDNHGTEDVAHIPKDGQLSITWVALEQTAVMTLKFLIYGVPRGNMVPDEPIFEFKFNVDATPPGDLSKQEFQLFQDEMDGSEEPYDKENDIHYDNDDSVFLKWGKITDGESGIGSYLIEVKKEGFYLQKKVPHDSGPGSKMEAYLGERVKESLPEGKLNLTIKAVDIVGNIGPPIFTTLIIDKTGPEFRVISPSEGEWAMSNRPTVTVEITDELSPIDGQTLFYHVSTNGGITFSEWESFEYYGRTKKQLQLEITPQFSEGTENVIEFKAQDWAGSGLIYSDEIPIWVDYRAPSISIIEPKVDQNGTTIDWLRSAGESIRITVHDHRGIGIDPNRISYRYSLGGESFSSDIQVETTPYNNSLGYEEYTFSFHNDNWQEGDENILVVDAWDLIGRNSTTVYRIRLDVTPEVEILSPDPTETYLDNETIQFIAGITDLDGDEDITVSWMSNIDGQFSFKRSDAAILTHGQHIITLTVDDGVHSMKRSFSLMIAAAFTEDPAYKDTDGDGMNDSYEKAHGMDPNIKDGDEDMDGDGFTNLEEYYAGTDPTSGKLYPGSTIKEHKLPILPFVLIIMGLLGLIVFGALMVRESNRTMPDQMQLPPSYYGQQALQPAPTYRPALPPAPK